VLGATWQQLDRFHALVLINTGRLSPAELHRRHLPVLEQLVPLMKRGQADGLFRSDLPLSWHLAVILAIVHAASGELHSGRIPEAEVEPAMLTTVAAAIGAAH
jgi:TetR/AcrR family transcriptional regulator, mexCD-oprJ operon repressor